LPAFRRSHDEFYLAGFNEVDRVARFPTGIDVRVFGDLDGARVSGLAAQGIAQLLDEEVSLRSLLNHRPLSYRCLEGPKTAGLVIIYRDLLNRHQPPCGVVG